MNSSNRPKGLGDKYLIFTLHGQTYGIAIATVCEINRLIRISPVPQVPDYVSGVMNLRGKVIPVVDLSLRFGFDASLPTRETCIIVTEGESGQVGNIVDSVRGVVDLTPDQVQPPPIVKEPGQLSFVIGVGHAEQQVIILVDTTQVLTRDELGNSAAIQDQGAHHEDEEAA